MLARSLRRSIQRSLGRFLSIAMIIGIGVAFFLGIRCAQPSMTATAAAYYDDTSLMDFHIVSTYGFNQNDIDTLQSDVLGTGEAAYSYDALSGEGTAQRIIKLHSFAPGGLNLPVLISGRMPERPDECLIDPNLTFLHPVGSVVTLRSGTDTPISDALARESFTVVGTARTPLYVGDDRGNSAIGNGRVSGYMLVAPENFVLEVYTDYYLRFSPAGSGELIWNQAEDVKAELEALADRRSGERFSEILAEGTEKLNDARTELADAQAEADAEIGDAQKQLDDARADLADAQAKVRDGEATLDNEIADAKKQLDDAFVVLEAARHSLNRANSNFKKDQQKIDAAKAAAKGNDTALAAVAKQQAEWDKARAAYSVSLREYKAERQAYDEAVAELETRREDGLLEIEEARAKLIDGEAEIITQQAKLDDARAEADVKLADAQVSIDEAQADLDDLDAPTWYVLDRDANPGLSSYSQDTQRIGAIGRVFPWIFFLVALLVCLTTITRMVEDRRTELGTLKALGYGPGSIAAQFIVYAALAGLLGICVGLPVGVLMLPDIIFSAYSILYSLPPLIHVAHPPAMVMAIAAALLVVCGTALFVCRHELAENPASLMRPKAPKTGKRVFLERIEPIWSRLNFTHKVTVRNLFRYKLRFFMTIIGVAGCTALMLTGFGVKNSVDSVFTLQFDGLMHYDVEALIEEAKAADVDDAFAALKKDGLLDDYTFIRQTSMDVTSGKAGAAGMETALISVPMEPTRLGGFISLRNRRTQEGFEGFSQGALGIPTGSGENGGAVITEKLAKLLSLSVGDPIVLEDEDHRRVTFFVTGIAENYALHYVYLTPETYAAAFEKQPLPNVALLLSPGASDDAARGEKLLDTDGITAVNYLARTRDMFSDSMKNLDPIVWVLILAAAALAMVVLLNLANINITERRRELATLRVLGFFDRETRSYIFRESIWLTALGIIAGLGLGVLLHRFVISTAEVNLVMFGKTIEAISYVYAMALSALFAIIANLLMVPKLRAIDMVESLKGVE